MMITKTEPSWIENTLASVVQYVREARAFIIRVHFAYRMLLQTNFALLVCSALLAVLLTIEIEVYDEARDRQPYAVWSNHLVNYSTVLVDENTAVNTYVISPTAENYYALLRAWSASDALADVVLDYYSDEVISASTSFDDSVSVPDALFMLSRAKLTEHRAAIYPILQTTLARSELFYQTHIVDVLDLSSHMHALSLSSEDRRTVDLTHLTEMMEGETLVAGPLLDDVVVGDAQRLAVGEVVQQYMDRSDMKTLTTDHRSAAERSYPGRSLTDVVLEKVIRGLVSNTTVPLSTLRPSEITGNLTAAITNTTIFIRSLLHGETLTESRNIKDGFVPYLVLCAAGVMFACINVVGALRHNREEEAQRRRCVATVEATVRRYHEYAQCFSLFDLDPSPVEPTDAKVHISLVNSEVMLQRCIASVRALAPYIPHVLFPERLTKAVKSLLEVRKQEQGLGDSSKPLAPKVQPKVPSPINLISLHEATNSPELQSVITKTSVGLRIRKVVMLTLDVSPLHRIDFSDPKAIDSVTDGYCKVLNLMERCIILKGGSIHSINADRVVAIWYPDGGIEEAALNAAEAGLQMVQRITHARRTHKILNNLPVYVGITSGDCSVGVIGSSEFKTWQVFGPPKSCGIHVARVSGTHGTNVCCDENTRLVIESTLPCKPIEILDGGIVYHVHPRSARREADFFAKLATYNKAFDLFEKQFYRDALKAFRQYTRQYGYDRSVEHIQSLITG
eukprot:PhM_4_TR18458/c0_g1_i1/m.34338